MGWNVFEARYETPTEARARIEHGARLLICAVCGRPLTASHLEPWNWHSVETRIIDTTKVRNGEHLTTSWNSGVYSKKRR